ncbi:MAG: ROK family protein [Alphaproteobacteria bacterium]|jgi:fructokinase|nr:ROK family protein [Alphaproteobacteria bacterium]
MRIGIDLGGTKIEAVAMGENGRILARQRVETPQGDYQATLGATAEIAARVEAEAGAGNEPASVGVAVPGAISPATGVVKNANSTCLIGQAFDADLARRLGRPVRMANDANCFALSEATDGAARGAASVFGVILGTGVGGGLVIDGKLHEGANLIAGEWGHNPLPWPDRSELPGRPCYCGKRGCIETFLSGPGLRAEHRDATGHELTPREILELSMDGDAAAEATLARYEQRLAKALAAVVNVVDPEVVVLGGGLSNIDRLYRNVTALWGAFVFSDEVATRLVKAEHGDSSGVRGAAWLWPEDRAP